MENFEFTAFLKALLFMQVAVHLHAISNAQNKPCVNSEIQEPDKALKRDGSNDGVSYVNLAKDEFSYLNITALNGDFVDNMPECSLACLDTPSCFSFNVGATRDVSNRFSCELLPSDKYNNSDKFVPSHNFHHFSIATPCSSWPCKNKGKCLPLYEENNYKCLCKGFKGKNCENDIDECSSANECHQNATCNNTIGSYNCTCKDGFEGDGKNCTDIDECSIENECHQNATCSNTKGSYSCTCKDGFEGDGRNCTENCGCWRSRSKIPNGRWRYGAGRVDAIDFQTNGNDILQGYRLWGVTRGSTSFQVTFSLYRGSTLLATKNGFYPTNSSVKTFEVHFSRGISVCANVTYTASALITTSSLSYAHSDGVASAFCSGITVTFAEISSKDTNGSSRRSGQFPALVFRSSQC